MFALALIFAGASLFAQSTAEDFAKWLPDMASQTPQTKQNAQLSWEKICMSSGAPGKEELRKEVNKLMTEQLNKDIPLDTKVWLLYQLRFTGDASVVPAVAARLTDLQTRVRDEAARVLAQNPSKEAEEALSAALEKTDNEVEKTRIKDALAARKLDLKVGRETEMPMAIPYASAEEVDKWVADYDKLNKAAKLQTIASLKVRADKKYLPLILNEIKGNDRELKTDAILALQKMGGTKEVPILLENRFGDIWQPTMTVIRQIVDDGFDEALLDALKKEKNNDRFFGLAEDLGSRNYTKALPTIIAFAKTAGCTRKHDMLKAAEPIASVDNIKNFVDITLLITDRGQRDEAEKVVARLCNNNGKPVAALMNSSNSVELLTLLGRIGDDESLKTVREARKNPQLQTAAIRALSSWPNAKVYQDLMTLAADANTPANLRQSALRGAIRVITLPDNQVGIQIDVKQRLEVLKKALTLAARNEEKTLVIERAAAIRAPETIAFVLPFVDDADFSERACKTIVEIAHHDNVRRPNKEVFAAALDKVMATTKDTQLKDDARKYRDNM